MLCFGPPTLKIVLPALCVTDRIRFLPVTMTGRFSNFNSTLYTEDRHELGVTGTKWRLLDTMSGIGEISISGPARGYTKKSPR